jgi:hypothetical protein
MPVFLTWSFGDRKVGEGAEDVGQLGVVDASCSPDAYPCTTSAETLREGKERRGQTVELAMDGEYREVF